MVSVGSRSVDLAVLSESHFLLKFLPLFCLCQTLLVFFFLQICYAIINLGKEIIEVQKVRFILVLAEQLKVICIYLLFLVKKKWCSLGTWPRLDFLLSLCRHFWSASSYSENAMLLTNTTAAAPAVVGWVSCFRLKDTNQHLPWPKASLPEWPQAQQHRMLSANCLEVNTLRPLYQ